MSGNKATLSVVLTSDIDEVLAMSISTVDVTWPVFETHIEMPVVADGFIANVCITLDDFVVDFPASSGCFRFDTLSVVFGAVVVFDIRFDLTLDASHKYVNFRRGGDSDIP